MNYQYDIFLILVGFIWEILATIDIIAVQQKKAFLSAMVTFILTWGGYTILYNLIPSPDFYWEITCLAMGCGLGAYITIKWNK